MTSPWGVLYRFNCAYATNSGTRSICAGNTAPPKVTMNQKNGLRGCRTETPNPTSAPITTARPGETMLYRAVLARLPARPEDCSAVDTFWNKPKLLGIVHSFVPVKAVEVQDALTTER